jgi:hypothetical protein
MPAMTNSGTDETIPNAIHSVIMNVTQDQLSFAREVSITGGASRNTFYQLNQTPSKGGKLNPE